MRHTLFFLLLVSKCAKGDRPEIKQDGEEVVQSPFPPAALLNVSTVHVTTNDHIIWSQCSKFVKTQLPDTSDHVVVKDILDPGTYYTIRKHVGDDIDGWTNENPKYCNSKLLKIIAGETTFAPKANQIALHQKYFVEDFDERNRFVELAKQMMTSKARHEKSSFPTEASEFWHTNGVLMEGDSHSESNKYLHTFQLLSSIRPVFETVTDKPDAYDAWAAGRDKAKKNKKPWLKLASSLDHTSLPLYPDRMFSEPQADSTDDWAWITCPDAEAADLSDSESFFEFHMHSGRHGDGNVQILRQRVTTAYESFPSCRVQPLSSVTTTGSFKTGIDVTQHVVVHMEYEVSESGSTEFVKHTNTLMTALVEENNLFFALQGDGGEWNQKRFHHIILAFISFNHYIKHSETSPGFAEWSKMRGNARDANDAWLKQTTSVNLAGSPLYNAHPKMSL